MWLIQDERYAAVDELYDWYQDYTTLKPFIAPYLRRNVPDFEILIPGCGNSSSYHDLKCFSTSRHHFFFTGLGSDLYDDGFNNVTNIDISSVVISQMNDKYSEKEDMECTELLIRTIFAWPFLRLQLSYPASAFCLCACLVLVRCLRFLCDSYSHGRAKYGVYTRGLFWFDYW